MIVCSNCNQEMTVLKHITNLHLTGDPKHISLMECCNCGKGELRISINANIGSGQNYVEFRIKLTDKEKKKMLEGMNQCPEPSNEACKCSIHDRIDRFEMQNTDRREILVDEYEIWN